MNSLPAPAESPADSGARSSRGRGRWVAVGIVVVVVAGVASAWPTGVFSPATPPGAGGARTPAPATKAVTRQDLAQTTPVTATLEYAGSYQVTGQGGGKLTWLPPAGKVIRQGQVLYQTGNGSPVVLLYGSVPAWRPLAEGTVGHDVRQLNRDLVKLGYAGRADIAALGWDHYSPETTYGVQRLEEHLGASSPPGSLLLGRMVFEPEALRVSQVTGRLGGPASGPILTATSDRHAVMIPLDVADQSEVKAGDKVTVTLPDGTNTPGTVSSVGKVASSGSGPGATMTVPVQVRLTDPKAAKDLDQAPVTVNIVTVNSPGPVLAVPVTALVAESPGGYVVETVGPGITRHWVRVTPGIFDDANGLVQVSGALSPGQRVAVAAS